MSGHDAHSSGSSMGMVEVIVLIFLRDNLHHYIIKDPNFPVNPTEALKNGFEAAEKDFLYNHALTEDGNEVADRSGSCAVIAILIGNITLLT